MKSVFLKRHFLLWGFTTVGLVLLLVAGMLASFWMASQSSQDYGLIPGLPLVWWRVAAYAMLLLFWPRLVYRLSRKASSVAPFEFSRRPLIILIVLYECLIVQNPLAILLRWVG